MQRLDKLVRERFSLTWGEARKRIQRGKILVDGTRVVEIGYGVPALAELDFVPDARRERPEDILLPPEAMLAIDDDIVVVDKPADVLTVPYARDDRNTMDLLLRAVLARRSAAAGIKGSRAESAVFVVHRLDRGTSGLLVFARNKIARDRLKDQLRAHQAHRVYLALVYGHVASTTIRNHLVTDRGDGLRGSVERAPLHRRRRLSAGRIAITHIEAMETLPNATLVACRLETGRTNQIRIHLSELGHPIVGETVYRRDHGPAQSQARRLCLHAAELGFAHPRTGEQLMFRSKMPEAMLQDLEAQRRG